MYKLLFGVCPSGPAAFRAHDMKVIPLYVQRPALWPKYQYCMLLMHRRYLENVPAIVPLLEKEYRNAAARLESTQEELNDLHPDK